MLIPCALIDSQTDRYLQCFKFVLICSDRLTRVRMTRADRQTDGQIFTMFQVFV